MCLYNITIMYIVKLKQSQSKSILHDQQDDYITHKAVRPGARPHVPPVMAEGDFRLMTPLYDNLQ